MGRRTFDSRYRYQVFYNLQRASRLAQPPTTHRRDSLRVPLRVVLCARPVMIPPRYLIRIGRTALNGSNGVLRAPTVK